MGSDRGWSLTSGMSLTGEESDKVVGPDGKEV